MSDGRAHTRVVMRHGTAYGIQETVQQILAKFDTLRGGAGAFIQLTSRVGQIAFPPEDLWLRVDEIASIQELSEESWVWQQQADSLHYARLLQDTPQEQIAQTQRELAEVLKGENSDG